MEQHNERKLGPAAPSKPAAQPPETSRTPRSAPDKPSPDWRREALLYLSGMKEWGRIHIRRWTHLFHSAAAGNLAVGPVSFLLVAGALGSALTLTTL